MSFIPSSVKTLTFQSWVAKKGLRGWFRDLSAVWGDPNNPHSRWPIDTLKAVCERGPKQPIVYDRRCNDSMVYFIANGVTRHRIYQEEPE